MATSDFRADLHAHTRTSDDSRTSVRSLLKAARAAGLHAIAVTDHDSVASQPEALRLAAQYKLQVIPGVEITADNGTHILGYFISQLPEDRSMLGIIQFIAKQGGVSCFAHPHRSDTGILYNLEKGRITKEDATAALKAVDLIELVNFKSIVRQEEDGRALALQYGKNTTASTDAHYTVEVGKAFTSFVLPEGEVLTPDSLRSAVRTLWSHPVPVVPPKKAAVPLMHYAPPVASVTRWKRMFGPVIPALGVGLRRWQEFGQKRAKENQITTILQTSPQPQIYQ